MSTPIYATDSGEKRDPIAAGNYMARCYQMIHIGTVSESINGATKILDKVRIGWELPTEMVKFKDEDPLRPLTISKEFTLSMNEKANLRKFLVNWRGKDFTPEQAKQFDITVLVGVPCLLNIIHKAAKNGNIYAEIGTVSPLTKGSTCPIPVLQPKIITYENWDQQEFEYLPEYIKAKMRGSLEYVAIQNPHQVQTNEVLSSTEDEDLPF